MSRKYVCMWTCVCVCVFVWVCVSVHPVTSNIVEHKHVSLKFYKSINQLTV